ncbi:MULTISPECIES: hypothetical protein [Campylobacter]|uniref:hypothetical protein n=1 Tax=Campylobacter TaxID=194 RepID=UPI000A32E68F|nr:MULTISPECIES: hypothetical protein [unclassified Campylobacter]MCR8695674.1 hypothetical protein [Campylobacter sp. RM19073]MEE3776229.1 hypothetical protein [Campylobacter sp. CX2-4080-23]
MINRVNQIQSAKIANNIPTMINSSLPVIIKVLEQTRFNRYNIKFGTKTISTTSYTDLEVGSEYYANIGSQSGGVISINSLTKRSIIEPVLDGGANLIEMVANSQNLSWLISHIKNKMANPVSKDEFSIYADMIMALNENILHIPFYYDNRSALLQIQLNKNPKIYLLFSIFAPLIISIKDGKFNLISSQYPSLGKALASELKCEFEIKAVAPLWQKATIKATI